EVLDERLIGQVTEGNTVELDVAAGRPRRRRADAVRRLFRRTEEFEDALGRSEPRLQQVQLRSDLQERHRELPRVRDERGHVAEAHRAGGDTKPADDGHAYVVQV